jgi:hypothetical protein
MSDKKPAKKSDKKSGKGQGKAPGKGGDKAPTQRRFWGKKDGPKGPSDTETQIARIKAKLREIRDYKKLIAQDGIMPDEDDKILESRLIVQLLRLEKGMPAKPKPKPKRKFNKKSTKR